MGKALIVVVAVVLFVYAFFDLVATPKQRVRAFPKLAWFVVIVVPFVGPLAWMFVGSRQQGRPPRDSGYGFPGGGRPPSRGPDDDPDFLRGL